MDHKAKFVFSKEERGHFFIQVPGRETKLVVPHYFKLRIRDLKHFLVEELSLESPKQITLIHSGKVLENDDMTITEYKINKETTILMLKAVQQVPTQFFIRTPTGEPLYFLYEPHQTIGVLKAKIESFIHIPARRQVLIFEEVCLYDDMKTLEECGINVGRTLDVEEKPSDIVRIWIQASDSQKFPIEISVNEKVKKIKRLLKQELQVEKTKQLLVYGKNELKSDRFLKDYLIKDDSIIIFSELFKLNIVVKEEGEEEVTIKMKVHGNETIKQLKEKIYKEHDVKPKDQTLLNSKEKVLKDNKTLSDYKINKKSLLILSIE